MARLGDPRRHYWLLQRMARTAGVDLVAAYDQGRICPQDWAEMVMACRRCRWGGHLRGVAGADALGGGGAEALLQSRAAGDAAPGRGVGRMSAKVNYLGDPNRAFWLTRSVARAIGVNLSEALHDGALTAGDYANMVTRCRMCPHSQTCETWLGVHGAGAERAPEHCANADLLNTLPARRAARA